MDTDEMVRAAHRRHGAELHTFALRLLRDDALAQDAVQEVFVRACRERDRPDPATAAARTWLLTLARGVVMDLVRRTRDRPAVATASGSEGAGRGPDADLVAAVRHACLVRTVYADLPDEQRVVLDQLRSGNQTTAEVADELDLGVRVVRGRAARGLRELREQVRAGEPEAGRVREELAPDARPHDRRRRHP